MKYLFLFVFCLLGNIGSMAQETYAEKLGYPKGKKVIIFHIDDAGMSYEANQGTILAMEKGVANSASVMMPCGWVPAYMKYLQQHPNTDAGVHLTLTSEWKGYRWFPLSGRDKVPGLHDKEGAMWSNVASVVKNASADEVETEIRAQIARFRQFGVEPSHIDSHMGTLFGSPAFTERYVKVGIQEKIPVMFPAGHATLISKERNSPAQEIQQFQQIGKMLWNAGLPVLDDLFADTYGWKLAANVPNTEENLRKMKTEKYIELLKEAKPGITMVIMHCAAPSDNFKEITDSWPTRYGDFWAMLDPALKTFIEKEGIILTTWREMRERRAKVK
ncbi:polysaccharide deacetylase family protein [Runella sp. MFBS21]|uniref:polysaccharide deacetylase family protein n=1 Tax=Runella sp. MFBS21 TaxID=3034018 RepID=UPI0023F62042|nr:polysaccharide deacetylase family protein [Runella sp. MFBS21]MDF7816546.1 polysaccharide deacetylase family protein [Runella sp. MFBS21]